MREYKLEKVSFDKKVIDKICCDLCGREGVKDGWESGYYEVNETEVEVTVHQREGKAYPDGDCWGTEYIIDMCPECFKNKLVPWIISQGGILEQKDWGS